MSQNDDATRSSKIWLDIDRPTIEGKLDKGIGKGVGTKLL
jgi:hypothetical protein